MLEQEWIDGVKALVKEYDDLQNNPLYWDQKDGFFLRARKIELEHNFGEMSPRWLFALLTELDKAAAVVAAAHVLLTNDDRDGLQVTISYRALETFKDALAAYGSGSVGGGV